MLKPIGYGSEMTAPTISAKFDNKATGLDDYIDPVTGLYEHDALLEELYDQSWKNPKVPSFLIIGDMINMTGVNDAAGRPEANRMIGAIAHIYHKALSETTPTALAGFKVHGDGMAWIVQGEGLSKEILAQALESAEKNTAELVRKTGLSGLEHPRYKNVTGTGLSASFGKIQDSPQDMSATKNALNLQLDALRSMLTKAANNTQPAVEYLNDHSFQKIDTALMQHEAKRDPIIHQFAAGFTPPAAAPDDIRGRREEMEDLSKLAGHTATLSRFTLYNLGGFNALLGNDHVDETILKPFEKMLSETIKENGIGASNYTVYKRDGGSFDLVIKDDDGRKAALVQKEIFEKMNREIFHKSVADFTSGHDIDIANQKIRPDILLADLPHKRDKIDGGGFMISTVKLDSYAAVPAIFERLDKLCRLQNQHGISYFEQGETHTRAWKIHTGPHNFIELPKTGELVTAADPIFSHLIETSSQDQLQDLFKKPVGMIYEGMTGISLSPVLERQKQIYSMIDRQISPEKILANLEPIEKFDVFAKKVLSDFAPSIDMAGRPSTRPQSRPEFLTFNLAVSWGFVPEKLKGIDNVILEGQAAIRGLGEIRDYQQGYHNADSDEILGFARKAATAILGDADKRSSPVQRAQLVNHAFKIAKHDAAAGDAADMVFVRAGYSLLHSTLIDVADNLRGDYGLGQMAKQVDRMANSLNVGPRLIPEEEAFKKIRAVVDPVMMVPTRTQTISASAYTAV